MLDTVKLRSSSISEELAAAVSQACDRRQGIRVATGELLYSLTAGALDGSWDHRISVKVSEEEWVCPTGKGPAVLVSCPPYLVVEGSVHKALLGHNIYGGPMDPEAACRWLISDLSGRLGVELPEGSGWMVLQADWSECYELPSFAAVQEYIHRLNSCTYPRRQVHRYGSEALHCPGATTTLKVYHKGPEFYKHDRKRLLSWMDRAHAFHAKELGCSVGWLQDLAQRVLRFEVSVRSRKLQELRAGKPVVSDLTRSYLEGVYDDQAGRLLREGKADMETVRKNREVSARLEATYKRELASRLFGTWMQLAALGEEVVKQKMSRPTFYRQRKQLELAGVSWKGADVRIVPAISLVPGGFAPVRSDPRRMTGEAPRVVEALEPFQRVA